LRNTAPLASALTAHGIATWNIEYRQVGDQGGGWPGTFFDWGSAVDHLRVLAESEPLDLTQVVAVGHSAGALAALWVAARGKLPEGSDIRGGGPLPVRAVVAIDGPGDLVGFIGNDAQVCDQPVIVPLMGGTSAQHPERYAQASPFALLPLGVPQYLVSSKVLTVDAADAYRDRATARGDKVEILDVANGGHFDIIAPGTKAWDEVEAFILDHAF
jgi:pimeloyl-ACP methyl ester carboxylesterase